MDYFQTNERYRKQELRNLRNWIVWLFFLGFCVWVGWFWGYSQRAGLTATTSDRVIRLSQQNERLEQRLASLSAGLDSEKRLRRETELLLEGYKNENSAQQRLNRQIAGFLAKGVSEDQIDLALRSLAEPLRCRPIEEKGIRVATGHFAGRESMAELIGGDLRVFMEGEAGRQATRDKPWFDPARPVSIRMAYLNGEKIHGGMLPLETSVLADSWLIRVKVSQGALQGYATVAVEKCSLQ